MDRNGWKRLGGSCKGEFDCEGVFLVAERGMVAVQGDHLVEARAPRGEAVVMISPELLKEAARALG